MKNILFLISLIFSAQLLAVDVTSQNIAIPTGMTFGVVGACPKGSLLNDGSAVSRTTYAKLFALVGTAFGIGNGSTTFNLPVWGYKDYGVMGLTATVSSPTKSVSPTLDKILGFRNGFFLDAEYNYSHAVAGANGSGDYLYSLPTGIQFDLTLVGLWTGAIGSTQLTPNAVVGEGTISGATGTYYGTAKLIAYSSTQFRVMYMAFAQATETFYSGDNLGTGGASAFTLGNVSISWNFKLHAPVVTAFPINGKCIKY